MPIYEYRCKKCGNTIDVLQKADDPAPRKCEACGVRTKLVKLVSRTSFVLKGGGWYADLYGSKKKDSGSTSDSKPAAAAADSTPVASAAPAGTPAAAAASTPAPAAAPAPAAKPSKPEKSAAKKK